jgi:hypothetical protein
VPYRSTCGTTSNEISYSLAQELTYAPQGPCAVVERCWRSLSFAPVEHLRRLLRDETYILFAPTIVLALDSPWADDRRGEGLTHADRAYYARECSQEAGTAAIYDGWTNALVFPTSYCAADPELDDIVMHELGHALTWRAAWECASARTDLLVGLPAQIRHHVFSNAYLVPGDEAETRRTRVLEALAEGYAWLAANRAAELPPRLTSELLDILSRDELRASRRLI